MSKKKVLKGLSAIRRHFYRNDIPIYYICHMSYYLMGLDEWLRRFRYITLTDCFDGAHPRTFSPPWDPVAGKLETVEEICNHLLKHRDVRDYIRGRGEKGKAILLMYDEETKRLCEELGLEVLLPSLDLRRRVDSKIGATRLGNQAGVESVPNILAKIESYADLRAKSAHLGQDLVIQTSFGDSGMTTFFVSNEADWEACAAQVVKEPEVKVMRRIRCRQAAIEACVTRQGTIVGPLMTEIVGFPELTPYKGGWAGNEIAAKAFNAASRKQARDKVRRLGDELYKIGYRGYFEVDLLFDQDSGTLYLGEINPRLSGASAMTNLSAYAHADVPLFLFHLLEMMDQDFEVDIDDLNKRWSDPDELDDWSQLIIKKTTPDDVTYARAPQTGVWRLNSEGTAATYRYMQTHRRHIERQDEAFFMRLMPANELCGEGWDLGILVAPGRMMTDGYDLTPRARQWISAIRREFVKQ